MILWLDAHLSPLIASWIKFHYKIEAIPVRDLGLRDYEDVEIFQAGRKSNAIIITKDHDFIDLISLYGKPPQIILLTCGNTSNDSLKQILSKSLKSALNLIENGESIVEITSE
jgi:predicted nuclease of predicted toxin-antitoxin system